jgi:hypothetical protein
MVCKVIPGVPAAYFRNGTDCGKNLTKKIPMPDMERSREWMDVVGMGVVVGKRIPALNCA